MIINPVTITVSRHHLETLLKAAKSRRKLLAGNSLLDRQIEHAIDEIEDALAAKEAR
jgi:hypothetical protein